MDPRRDFERLALPLQNGLYAAARAFCGQDADAQDLLQETWLRAWRAFATFDRSNPKAWLFTILRNAHLDRCRRRRLEPVSLDPERPSPAAPPAPSPALPDHLHAALRRLSPTHQLLLLLSDVEGLRYREIADVLGCPIGSVMSGLHHARARLRAELG